MGNCTPGARGLHGDGPRVVNGPQAKACGSDWSRSRGRVGDSNLVPFGFGT